MTGSASTETSQLDDLQTILLTEDEIRRRVHELGAAISQDYQGKDTILIGILKGGITFLADLSRAITIPHQYDLVGAMSYKGGTRPTDDVQITKELILPIRGRHVLLTEDIYDTGNTLATIHTMLKMYQPASLEICALLSKKKHRKRQLDIKYVGFEIDDVFVVGYGLDYKEMYRNLRCIGVLSPELYT
jgi:hypoxanthine phosphoribosyltransferase